MAINPYNAQEQMTRHAKSQRDGGIDNGVNRGRNVGGKDLFPAEFLVSPMSGEPYFAQRPFFRKDDLRVKHGSAVGGGEKVSACASGGLL